MTIKVRSYQVAVYQEKYFKVLSVLGSGGFGTCYKAIVSRRRRWRRNSFSVDEKKRKFVTTKPDVLYRRKSVSVPERTDNDENMKGNKINNSSTLDNSRITIFCLKKINRTSKTKAALQSFVAETKDELFRLEHPNIVKLLAATPVSVIKEEDTKLDTLWMAFEYIDGYNLKTLLENENESMSAHRMCEFGKQIASALDHVHSYGIVHLDLKPANVMVTRTGECKLADFGCSQYMESDPVETESLLTGTFAYRAPELHRGSSPTPKCDVYALGICLWQFWSRVQPFVGMPQHAVIYNVVKKNLRPSFDGKPVHEEYRQLVVQCWSADPEKRSSLSSIISKLDKIQNTSIEAVKCYCSSPVSKIE